MIVEVLYSFLYDQLLYVYMIRDGFSWCFERIGESVERQLDSERWCTTGSNQGRRFNRI